MLHLLVSKVGEQNIKIIKKVKRMGKIKGVERMKILREIKETIGKISETWW